MKSRFFNLLAIATIAVACAEEQLYIEPTPGKEVAFSANLNSSETKTLYGADADNAKSVKVKWVDGDKIKIYGNNCSRKQAEYSISAPLDKEYPTNRPNNDDGKAWADAINKTGETGVQWGNENSDFFAIYPSSTAGDFRKEGNTAAKVKTSISSIQYNTFSKDNSNVWQGTPYDNALKAPCMNDAIMYSYLPDVQNGSVVDFSFKPFTTVLKFRIESWYASSADDSTIPADPTGTSVQVRSISLTAPVAVAGEFDLKISNNGAEAIEVSGYGSSNTIVVYPAEQLAWSYGEKLEFNIFTIPFSNRSLSELWTVIVETTDGKRQFKLKPEQGSKPNLIAGKIHKVNVPGFPVKSSWSYEEDTWVESIPRNVYLSEISLPGSWYANDQRTDKGYQRGTLTQQYEAGIRAFNIDCRLTLSTSSSVTKAYKTHSSLPWYASEVTHVECRQYTDYIPHATDGVLVLACSGTEDGSLGTTTSISQTVEEAVTELVQLLVNKKIQKEFIQVILTVAEAPVKESTGYEYIRGTVNPQMMAIAINKAIKNLQSTYPDYIYGKGVTPDTTLGDVEGKIVFKVNMNTSNDNIIKYNNNETYGPIDAPMLISEGSMASSNISGDIVAGVFDKKQTTSMYWSNSYPTENNNLSEMKYYYHQCQNSSGADMIAKRKEAIWDIISSAKDLYFKDHHNSLYQISVGGWTSDNTSGKLNLSSQLNPFLIEIINAMINESAYTVNIKNDNGATVYTETIEKMVPSPIGSVLMNFSTIDALNGTQIKSSELIKAIIDLNAKCPMAYDPNKPAWGTGTSTEPTANNAAYAIVGPNAF